MLFSVFLDRENKRGALVRYIYGNSSPSNLNHDYLEFLRLSLDFSVAVLQSETKIAALHTGIKEAKENAQIERVQIIEMTKKISDSIDTATNSTSTAMAISLRENLRVAFGNEVARTQATIESTLEANISRASAKITSEREANVKRLETILLNCDLPDSKKRYSVTLSESDSYVAKLDSISDDLLHFETLLHIPANSIFSQPIRIDSLMPELQINIPEAGGWLKRGMKVTPQKLAKEYVFEISQKPDGSSLLSLRNSPKEGQAGYDILFQGKGVWVTRITKQQEAGEPYQISEPDAQQLLLLHETLHEAATQISWNRNSLSVAEIAGVPLATHPEPDELILWLIEHMTPIVIEISKNSLNPTELVLKRVLSDDRREEIFTSKTELFAKLNPLTSKHKAYFAPLGLNIDNHAMNGLPTPKTSKLNVQRKTEALQTIPADTNTRSKTAPIASKAPTNSSSIPLAEPSMTSLKIEDEPIVVESSIQLPEDPTSEIDLNDLDDEPIAPIAPPIVPTKPIGRPTVPPPRNSSPSIRPSQAPLPPRPSTAPGSSSSSKAPASEPRLSQAPKTNGAKTSETARLPSIPPKKPRNSKAPAQTNRPSGTLFNKSTREASLKSGKFETAPNTASETKTSTAPKQ